MLYLSLQCVCARMFVSLESAGASAPPNPDTAQILSFFLSSPVFLFHKLATIQVRLSCLHFLVVFFHLQHWTTERVASDFKLVKPKMKTSLWLIYFFLSLIFFVCNYSKFLATYVQSQRAKCHWISISKSNCVSQRRWIHIEKWEVEKSNWTFDARHSLNIPWMFGNRDKGNIIVHYRISEKVDVISTFQCGFSASAWHNACCSVSKQVSKLVKVYREC